MAIHRISFETMHFVSKGGTDGTDGGIEKWDDAFTCYGPGPKGIEHEGIRFGFGNMDKVVEIADWEKIKNSKRGFFNNIKRYIGF